MIDHDFKRLFSLLPFAFGFWSVQGLGAQEINSISSQCMIALPPEILLFLTRLGTRCP
jgi:hypothetical protein